MRMHRLGAWLALTLMLSSPLHAGANELQIEGADPGLAALIERYVSALRSSDLAAYEALHQPLLDRCRTSETRDVYDDVLRAEVQAHVEADPNIVVQALDPSEINEKVELLSKVAGQGVEFGITPSHAFELTERAPHPATHPCASQPARIRKFAVRHEGQWKIVPQCLAPAIIDTLRDTRMTKDAVRRMQAELYGNLSPDVRSELLDQLSRGETQAAFERAAKETGSNGKALRLIERLCEDF